VAGCVQSCCAAHHCGDLLHVTCCRWEFERLLSLRTLRHTVQLVWLVHMLHKKDLFTSRFITLFFYDALAGLVHLQGRYSVRVECMWPISDAAAAVQVFKAQLLNQHDIASTSALPTGTANAITAGTANATPSTSVQVCSASPPQTLHFTWTLCLLVDFHAFHLLC